MNTIAVSNVVQTIFLQKIGKGRRFDSVYPAPVRIDERDIGQASRYDFCLCAVPGFRQFRPHDAQKFDVFFRPPFDQRKLLHLGQRPRGLHLLLGQNGKVAIIGAPVDLVSGFNRHKRHPQRIDLLQGIRHRVPEPLRRYVGKPIHVPYTPAPRPGFCSIRIKIRIVERDFEQDRQTLLVGKACGIDALIERSGERQPNRHYPVFHHLIEYLLALGGLEPGHIHPVDAKARIRKSTVGRNRE